MPQLTQSQEDYLETILALERGGKPVEVRAIARRQGVSMPSVHGALKRLIRLGLVLHDRYDYVRLTAVGRRRAVAISDRHVLLRRFLSEVLHLPMHVAEEDACALEHYMSSATITALTAFVEGATRERRVHRVRRDAHP